MAIDVTPRRRSGVLAHISSLPGPYGLGELGLEARHFVDQLVDAGQTIWQILPLNPADEGGCPYSSPSAFAGDTRLVSIDTLVGAGLLSQDEAAPAQRPDNGMLVDFSDIYPARETVLMRAFERIVQREDPAFAQFKTREASWLDDYALFEALAGEHGSRNWLTWPGELKLYQEEALEMARRSLRDEIEAIKAGQFVFDTQWRALKAYANRRGISILGDLPIYVSLSSADVWANRANFRLTSRGEPIAVSGCPPDYFSEDGQLWGNPIYNWAHQKDHGFDWWVARMQRMADLYDIVRLDHFRAFSAYWEVPADAETAADGAWQPSPGESLFREVRRALPDLEIIAEDLGDIDAPVYALRDKFEFPGMRIVQYELGEMTAETAPQSYSPRSVAYIGTHDNATARGWIEAASEDDVNRLSELTGSADLDRWTMAKFLLGSGSDTVIHQLQDLIWLGDEARFNVPGSVGPENWSWRLEPGAFDEDTRRNLRDATVAGGRLTDR